MWRGARSPLIAATISRVWRVSTTLCTRYTRAPIQAQTAVAASVPVRRWSVGRPPRVYPTKSLFDRETSTGQPVPIISGSRRVTSSEW